MNSSIDSFLDKFVHVKTGRRTRDSLEQAHAKVLHHLHKINSETVTPKDRRNARQNLRRLLAKHPLVMQMVEASNSKAGAL
jgi:hypothetical protein